MQMDSTDGLEQGTGGGWAKPEQKFGDEDWVRETKRNADDADARDERGSERWRLNRGDAENAEKGWG